MTLAGPQTDEWLNTSGANGAVWTDTINAGTNWSLGAVPGSSDDVLIDQSGAGPYTVSIPDGASATAASLTLNTGNATLSDQGALTLDGALTIQAGDFQLEGGTLSGETAITNAGTFEIAEAFTLAISITNTDGIVQVDAGDMLTLSDPTISGGTINDGTSLSGATIDVAGDSEIENANLNNGGVTVASGVTLWLDNDTVTGTTFTDTASGAIIAIDPADTLTVSGVMINGGTINDGTVASGATISVSGNSEVENAALNNGDVSIEAGVTLTLDGTTATGSTITSLSTTTTTGTVNVDSGQTLRLAGTDAITGGAFAIFAGPVQTASGNSVLFTNVSIADLNPSANPSVTVTIQASSGSFAAISGSGLTVSGSGDDITITGDLTDINNAINNGIIYTPRGHLEYADAECH